MSKLEGTLYRIVFQNEENGYLVGAVNCDAEEVTVTGTMLSPQVGLTYAFEGEWSVHPRYGRQFTFETAQSVLPIDFWAVHVYLQENIKWIGPVTARALTDTFGEDVLDICKADPDLIASKIAGITPTRALEIQQMLVENEANEKLLLGMAELFKGLEVSRAVQTRLVNAYKHQAISLLKRNPYEPLGQVRGYNFPIADKIAKRVGIGFKADIRLRAGILYALTSCIERDGHTCAPRGLLNDEASGVLGLMPRFFRQTIRDLLADGDLVEYNGRIYSRSMWEDERIIARKLLQLAQNETRAEVATKLYLEQKATDLKLDQRQAVEAAANSSVFILTGPPGTGKTYTVDSLLSMPGMGLDYELCAPTGKAAKRLEELTGIEAKTVHRMLAPGQGVKVDGNTDSRAAQWAFGFNATNHLPHSVIVLDEASMMDTWLMARLCEAIAPDTRLIIVGDVYQLPSVGPGCVLRDLIASGQIPCMELTETKRQDAGLIIRNCHAIKEGGDITVDPDDPDTDFQFFDCPDEDEAADAIVKLASELLPEVYGVDPIQDIQVVTALRTRSELSCMSLNDVLQERFTGVPQDEFVGFNCGDKVIQTQNNYELNIMNGDVGIVMELDKSARHLHVRFLSPDRTVTMSMDNHALQLAYAVTCHKYQGSEAPIVIIPVHPELGDYIPQRNWLYTAVSRARDLCVLVGDRREVREIISRDKQVQRYTGLQAMLEEV